MTCDCKAKVTELRGKLARRELAIAVLEMQVKDTKKLQQQIDTHLETINLLDYHCDTLCEYKKEAKHERA